MQVDTLAIYSAGGFAREIEADIALSGNAEVVFIDDDRTAHGTLVHGKRVVSYDTAKLIPNIKVCVAFASPELRRRKVDQCTADGLEFFSIVAPTARIGPNVAIGDGAIFAHLATVTSDARIGRHFHCNIYSYVAHDCIVGDFVTFAPRVSLNGRIKVEDDVYVGSDATFLPGTPNRYLTIGKGAIVGAGAVVTKDVEPGSVMVGSPARPR